MLATNRAKVLVFSCQGSREASEGISGRELRTTTEAPAEQQRASAESCSRMRGAARTALTPAETSFFFFSAGVGTAASNPSATDGELAGVSGAAVTGVFLALRFSDDRSAGSLAPPVAPAAAASGAASAAVASASRCIFACERRSAIVVSRPRRDVSRASACWTMGDYEGQFSGLG